MRLKAQDIAAYAISSLLVAIGITIMAIRLSESVTIPRPTTADELHQYISLHRDAYFGLALVSIGAALLVYHFTSRETPLWEIGKATKVKMGRSPLIAAFGILMVVLAFGAAAILLHQGYNLPAYYTSTFEQSNELAVQCMFVGFVGAGVFLYGVLFSRAPDMESAEREAVFYNRPVWHCLAMIGAGIAIAVASYLYGSLEFEEYAERHDEATLSLIVISGFLIALVVFLSGLSMLAKSSFSIHFRGELNPVNRIQDKGH
jgi:hypothetical protein